MCYEKSNIWYPKDKLGPLTKHHRRPRSKGGSHLGNNISMIPEKLHQAYHLLFVNWSPQQQCDFLNEHFVDPDYHFVPIPKDFLEIIYKTLSKHNNY